MNRMNLISRINKMNTKEELDKTKHDLPDVKIKQKLTGRPEVLTGRNACKTSGFCIGKRFSYYIWKQKSQVR